MATAVVTTIPTLCYSLNFPDLWVQATGPVTVVLKKGVAVDPVLTELYQPCNGMFVIKLRKLLHSLLVLTLPDGDVFSQWDAMSDFTLTIDGVDHGFRIIRGGINGGSVDYSALFRGGFMTNQLRSKMVKYLEPQYLNYYAEVNCLLKTRCAWIDGQGTTHDEEVLVFSMLAGNLYTINVQFARLHGLFSVGSTPGIIEVFVEGRSYTQSYWLTDQIDLFDDVFLYENSRGGLESIRFTGQIEETNESEFMQALFYETVRTYDVVAKRKFKKYTGYLAEGLDVIQVNQLFLSQFLYYWIFGKAVAMTIGKVDAVSVSGVLNGYSFEFAYAFDDALIFADRDDWSAVNKKVGSMTLAGYNYTYAQPSGGGGTGGGSGTYVLPAIVSFVNNASPAVENYDTRFAAVYGQDPTFILFLIDVDPVTFAEKERISNAEPVIERAGGLIVRAYYDLGSAFKGRIKISL